MFPRQTAGLSYLSVDAQKMFMKVEFWKHFYFGFAKFHENVFLLCYSTKYIMLIILKYRIVLFFSVYRYRREEYNLICRYAK